MTSATAPGITHRWTNLWTYADEVSHSPASMPDSTSGSRLASAQDMGRKIGRFVVENVMKPATVADAARRADTLSSARASH